MPKKDSVPKRVTSPPTVGSPRGQAKAKKWGRRSDKSEDVDPAAGAGAGAGSSPRVSKGSKKVRRSMWFKRKGKKTGIFNLPFDKAAVAEDSNVPIVLRMLLQFVEENGMDKLGIYQTAGRKVDALLSRINDGPEYWLASDETLSKEDGVFAAAELIRTFFQEQPDPLLLESDALADEINTYRVGSDMTAALQEAATEVVGALQPQARACVGALARHASTVVSHRANNGTMMLGLAEAFAETTGVRAELLAFLFAHSDELELDDAPPPCTREQYFTAVRSVIATKTAVKSNVDAPKKESSCEDVIPDDEEERMSAELRVLELSLARHHDGIRAAADRGEAYPGSAMEEMLTVQRKLTALKRTLKTSRDSTTRQEVHEQAGSAKLPRPSAAVALEKQYSELVLEHDELVAISEVLKNELQIEKEIMVEFETAATSDATPIVDPILSRTTDRQRLQSLLDAEMYTLGAVEDERSQLVNSLLKERTACAALNVQIRQLDGASKVWNYKLADDGPRVLPHSPNPGKSA